MANGLTTKQEAFVDAYIGEARFNATKAALMAGYSERSARQEGSRLLSNDDISARISEELRRRSMPGDAVLAELTDIATANWREFVTIKTNPKTGAQIEVSMDLGAKVKSLEILAKAHGLLTDKIDLTGNLTATVELVGVAAEDV
ncbi:MAG: terminase small subunit [Thermomicrobiales bacterium]|nr:terminase small subunit [Thermomicrobiales bacterium]